MNEKDECNPGREMGTASGQRGGQIHEQVEEHFHGHYHGHVCLHKKLNQSVEEYSSRHAHGHLHGARCAAPHARPDATERPVLTIRSHSGISGDMLLCGLAILNLGDTAPDSPEGVKYLHDLCASVMPDLAGCFTITQRKIGGICGWRANVALPPAHEHRGMDSIREIMEKAQICEAAKNFSGMAFDLLAACEAAAHGVGPDEVHFHEIGALDSILDICGASELYARLGSPKLVCGALPVADGEVECAHGVLPAPAPAALRLLAGMPVRPFPGNVDAGELLTPTGLALLRAFAAEFGPWPDFRIYQTALVYGQREFANVPNGVIFAIGKNS